METISLGRKSLHTDYRRRKKKKPKRFRGERGGGEG